MYRIWQDGFIDEDFQSGKSLGDDPWWVVVTATAYVGGEYFGLPAPLALLLCGSLGSVRYWVITEPCELDILRDENKLVIWRDSSLKKGKPQMIKNDRNVATLQLHINWLGWIFALKRRWLHAAWRTPSTFSLVMSNHAQNRVTLRSSSISVHDIDK